MDTATVVDPAPQPVLTGPRSASGGARGQRARARVLALPLHRVALTCVLAAALVLRLWGIKQGLPYSYNLDEATHFVPRAIAFFSHDLNPRYFLNPPAYSYLLHIVFEVWFGSGDSVSRTYTTDPTTVFVIARVVTAVLGVAAVGFTYLAGARLLGRTVGLLAAAILGFAFLPAFYSHLALNDVPTLAPVALSLLGIAGVLRRGRWRDYILAGASIGVASATKYTGGITLVCLLAAFVCDGASGGFVGAVRRLGAGLAAAAVAFVVCNPYAVLDWNSFTYGLSQQASLAAGQDPVKLGTGPGDGMAYYLWTFTWGLGWVPSLAALGGSVLLLVRRRLALALVLLPACVAFIVFMGSQQRYFGRWLMPLFPVVAILGAYGAVELARRLARTGWLRPAVAGGLTAVLLLAQSLVAVIHDDAVLARPDTRNLTRSWMVSHVPAGARVVIEPVVSGDWTTDIGRSLPWTPTGERWYRYPTWLTNLDARGHPLPDGRRRYVVVDQYERTLRPALLRDYVSGGFCWVVVGSLQADRAFAQPAEAPQAIAYYAALRRRARLVYLVSPFSAGARPVPFNFDWSIDYFPRQYHLPGPEMSVYHLSGGRCGSR